MSHSCAFTFYFNLHVNLSAILKLKQGALSIHRAVVFECTVKFCVTIQVPSNTMYGVSPGKQCFLGP